MILTRRSITAFMLRVILALPLCFAAWYFAWKPLSSVPVWLSSQMIELSDTIRIERAEATDHQIKYTLRIGADDWRYRSGKSEKAVADVDVSVLIYTYGLPFFVALILAAWSPLRIGRLIVALGILFIGQAFSVGMDLLKQLVIDNGAALSQALAFPALGREAIAIGYQIGALLLPTLVPIILWLSYDNGMLKKLVEIANPGEVNKAKEAEVNPPSA